MDATVVHCLGALLVANEACRDFELTISTMSLNQVRNLWAFLQVSYDIWTEISLEVMFRTLRNARLSLGS